MDCLKHSRFCNLRINGSMAFLFRCFPESRAFVVAIWLAILLFSFVFPSAAATGSSVSNEAPESSLESAQELIGQGRYGQGLEILKRLSKDKGLTPQERAAVMMALAEFHEERAGDYRRSKTWLRKIVADPASKNGPLGAKAKRRLERFRRLEEEHAESRAFFLQARTRALQPGGELDDKQEKRMLQDMKSLREILDSHPDFYLNHEIRYLLGLLYLKTGRSFRADRQFAKASASKPALFMYLPVRRLQQNAREQWVRNLGRKTALGVSAVLMAALAAAFAAGRPWIWVRFRHLIVGVLAALLWSMVFWGAMAFIGQRRGLEDIVNRDHFYPPPTYAESKWGSPGSEVAGVLFAHGTAALGATWLFSAMVGRMKKRRLAFVLNAAFATLSAASILTMFYFQHCDFKSRYYAGNDAHAPWLGGYLAFRLSEPEPYLLVNPTAYPDIELDSINDPELVLWLKRFQ